MICSGATPSAAHSPSRATPSAPPKSPSAGSRDLGVEVAGNEPEPELRFRARRALGRCCGLRRRFASSHARTAHRGSKGMWSCLAGGTAPPRWTTRSPLTLDRANVDRLRTHAAGNGVSRRHCVPWCGRIVRRADFAHRADVVFVSGGRSSASSVMLSSVFIFDPSRNVWSTAPSLWKGRAGHASFVNGGGGFRAVDGRNIATQAVFACLAVVPPTA